MKKIYFISVIALASVLLFSAVPASPGANGLVKTGVFDRLRVNAWFGDVYLDSNTDAYLLHGIGFTTDNVAELTDWLPVDIDYYVDGEEINLKRYTEAWPNQYYWTSPGPDVWWLDAHKAGVQELWFMFYQTFDAGYFEPGEYSLDIFYFIQGDNLVLEIHGMLFVT
ncbi:MAG: hypothetical protein ACXAD7_13145 [Candidatus Kariarchaeaceae archaeon]